MFHVTFNLYKHTAQYNTHIIPQGVTQGENLQNIYIQIHTVVTYTLHNTFARQVCYRKPKTF